MKIFKLFYPVRLAYVNQAFGTINPKYDQFGLKGHNGIDFRAIHGQPVRAAHDGIVTYSGLDQSNGSLVIIRTHEMLDYNGRSVYYKTVYGHLVHNIPVKAGSTVKVGDIIGWADNTGFSTGDHLHFGLKPQIQSTDNEWDFMNAEQNNGYKGSIDPKPFFNGVYAEDAQTYLNLLQQQITVMQKVVEIYRKILSRINKIQ